MKPETAIKKAGSVSALSRLLGVTRQAVQSYRRHGLPAERLADLQRLKPEWFKPRNPPKAAAE